MNKLFVACPSLDEFYKLKVSTSKMDDQYVIGDGEPASGEPDIKWNRIVFIAAEQIIWTRGNMYGNIPYIILSREEYEELEEKNPRSLYFILENDAIMGIYAGDIPFNVIFHDNDNTGDPTDPEETPSIDEDAINEILKDYIKKEELGSYISDYLIASTEELNTYIDE